MAHVTEQNNSIIKRSVTIAGHSTSVSLEAPFWDELKAMAQTRGISVNQLVTEVDQNNPDNLSSALRCYVLRACKGF